MSANFSGSKLNFFEALTLVRKINRTRNICQDQGLNLWDVFFASQSSAVTDKRDYVYGIIGMADPVRFPTRRRVDYTKSIEEVFTEATMWIILEEQKLVPLNWICVVPAIRPITNMPSWALYFEENGPSLTSPGFRFLFDKVTCPARITISENVLTVHGFVLDIVASASENFTHEKIATQISEAYNSISSSQAYGNIGLARKALWQTLLQFGTNERDPGSCEEQFESVLVLFPSIFGLRNRKIR